VAYIGYDARLHTTSSQALPRKTGAKIAWGRLTAVGVSLLAWVGIIAAARAIF
jgi:hypothetical protein